MCCFVMCVGTAYEKVPSRSQVERRSCSYGKSLMRSGPQATDRRDSSLPKVSDWHVLGTHGKMSARRVLVPTSANFQQACRQGDSKPRLTGQSPVTSPSLTTDRRQPRGPFDLDNVQVSQVQFGPFVWCLRMHTRG